MIILVAAISVLAIIVFLFLEQESFGKNSAGARLERIKKSPNYKDGAFRNIHHTPDLTEGVTFFEVIKEFFFEKRARIAPDQIIPSIKTDLFQLRPEEMVLIWFGHSSYFLQLDGRRILVDPVFSGAASPLPFGTKAFPGTDIYSTEEIPEIDYLFITHDHWDHLDYKTVKKLKHKIKKVFCGLGVGAHLERWGYAASSIVELDWNEHYQIEPGFNLVTASARHFSGRGIRRNQSLWLSFILQTPTKKIFIGGDSGFDSHLDEIGKQYGEFDLAVLENGQYDRKWRYIHLMPDEILDAAASLNAKRILPVHSAKFILGNHPWDEPLELITRNNETRNLNIITPMIGEKVSLNDVDQKFTTWWRF